MSSNGWTMFGNTVNILTCLQMLTTGLAKICSRRSTACARLAEVKTILDSCDNLLVELRDKDQLLGKIVEKRQPNFLSTFAGDIMDLRAQYREYDECLRNASWKDSEIPWSELVGQIEVLRDQINDIYQDRLRTSNRVRNHEPVYTAMRPVFYRRPQVLTEEQLDRELDRLDVRHQFLTKEFGVYTNRTIATKTDQSNPKTSAPDSETISLLQMPGALS